MTLRLLHLSDIHFGMYGAGWDGNDDQRKQLVVDVRARVKESGPIDAVLVGGDIAFSGQPGQYEAAAEWLQQVCAAAQCDPAANVWVVPGNHDVDWTKIGSVGEAYRSAIRACELVKIDTQMSGYLSGPGAAAEAVFEPFAAYNQFALERGCGITPDKPFWHESIHTLDDLSVKIRGVNSALVSDKSDDVAPDTQQLVLWKRQVEFPTEDDAFQIVMCHHPPNWIRDWDNLAGYFTRVHLVLFGHTHTHAADHDTDHGTVRVYAGAVGPDKDSPTGYGPGYNIVELARSDGRVTVTVEHRVWRSTVTRFGPSPTGLHVFPIEFSEAQVTDGEQSAGKPEPETPEPGLPSSPLAEEHKGHAAPAEGQGRSGIELRRIGLAYFRLAPTDRDEIARKLGVFVETEADLPEAEKYTRVLLRVREQQLIDELEKEVGSG